MRYFSYDSERKKTTVILILITVVLLLICALVALFLFPSSPFNSDGDGSGSDNGELGTNITTGEFDIDIIDDKGNSLDGKVLDFIVDGEKGEAIFEPGVTFYTEGFRIKNCGTIPLKYTVSISNNTDDVGYKFTEAFEVWITKDRKSLTDAKGITTFSDFLGAAETGDTYYLVIAMKSGADNDFQNREYSGIGITVHAEQLGATE